jgi:hypothetical protein
VQKILLWYKPKVYVNYNEKALQECNGLAGQISKDMGKKRKAYQIGMAF